MRGAFSSRAGQESGSGRNPESVGERATSEATPRDLKALLN